MIPGPITVEVRGITEPDATVKVNGATVVVRPDGRFAKVIFVRAKEQAEITVEAEKDGKSKKHVRQFPVRK